LPYKFIHEQLVTRGLKACFLGLFWNEKRENGNFQKLEYEAKKKDHLKTDCMKSARGFSSSGSTGEFKFAANALLFWSAI